MKTFRLYFIALLSLGAVLVCIYHMPIPIKHLKILGLPVNFFSTNDNSHLLRTSKIGCDDEWKSAEERELSDIIQKRLKYIQNPKNCASARKILCELVSCGFGCQIQHIIFCLLTAYATNRTLVVNFDQWQYKESLQSYYEPLSETCKYIKGMKENSVNYPGTPADSVIFITLVGYLNPLPTFMFPAIPRDLANRLVPLKEEPFAWWIGQLYKYVLRPKNNLIDIIEETRRNIGYTQPVVGIQVRRTDKIQEAKYHNLTEYMEMVIQFYQQLDARYYPGIQRVFLATDDPAVLTEAKLRYPSFTFLSSNSSSIASSLHTRFTKAGLLGIIMDIHFLSRSTFLVCTFTSNVCRMAYAIMTTVNPDTWKHYRSLDSAFEWTPLAQLYQVAIMSQTESKNGIELKTGDIIRIVRNEWNGFTQGTNMRTNKTGRFPTFMAVNTIPTAEMPLYHPRL